MEFLPDTENNARNVAFLNKTKNQAKKLFKLAKQNQLKIEIENLSHAQEILAQINGFPDWHALEKTIKNVVLDNHYNSLSVTNINEKIEDSDLAIKQLETYKGIPVLQEYHEVMSLVSVDYVSNDYYTFISFMNDIIKATSFQFNMEFHKVNILIEQTEKKQEPLNLPDAKYFPINSHENLGLNLEQLKEFFNVSYLLNNNKSNFTISAQILITTDKSMIDEHVKFCNIFTQDKFKDFFSFKDILHYDENNICSELKNFQNNILNSLNKPTIRGKDNQQSLKTSYSVYDSHFSLDEFLLANNNEVSSIQFNHSKWILALYLLSQRQHQWKLNINLLDLSSKQINYFILSHSENENSDTYNINTKYLQGLYKSLTSDNFNFSSYSDSSYQKMFAYKNNVAKTLPWSTGIPLINREDNVLDYFQPGSAKQRSWVNAIFAKPGSGKSVLMNMINLGLCFAPGIQRLPRIGIVDIGPSSYGLISFLKESLPIGQKHLVQYHKVRMIEEYCVNIFDTQLGCRFPTSEHRSLLTNMLLLLVDNATLWVNKQGMTGLVQAIIDDMYLQCSEKGYAKRYDKGLNEKVDSALRQIKYHVDFKTTWWDVVDALFTHDMINEATIAQRYAVPLLLDATISAQKDSIRNIYGEVKLSTGETLIQHFNRVIIDALNQYKILGRPTVFDISDARIVSLDLDEVAKSGGAQADKQTAVMYMFARFILGKNFKLNPDTLHEMPYPAMFSAPETIPVRKYKAYHSNLIESYKEDFRQLCFDEFHRVSRFNILKEQTLIDMRERHKYSVGVTIASQSLDSFDENMTTFFSNVFIMDGGNQKDCGQIAEKFNLSSYEKELLLQGKVHGPRSGHSGTILAKFSTNLGNYSKLVSIPLNTTLGWCLSTTMEDVQIRERLSRTIGYSMAIKLLSKHYPYGIKKMVEIRKEKLLKQNEEIDVEFIVEDMTKEILAKEFKDV